MNLLLGPLDNFNRANGPIGGSNNWAADSLGNAQISSNTAIGLAGQNSGAFRTDAFYTNQYSQVTINVASLSTTATVGVSVRNQDNANGYLLFYQNSAGTYSIQLYKKVAGAFTQLTSVNLSGPVAIGTKLVLIAENNVITGYMGLPTGTSQTVAVVDTTFPSGGTPGIVFFDSTASISQWTGGRAGTGPYASTISTDNFNRANGLVSAGQPNWTDLNTTFSGVACNGASIVSNTVNAPSYQHYSDYRNETYSNDQWARFGKDNTSYNGQPFNMGMVRWNGTSCYIGGLFEANPPGIQIYTVTSGASSTAIASAVTTLASYVNGSFYDCVANGSRISVRLNGTEVIYATDSTRTAGQPGFMIFGATGGNNFAAGNVHG